MTLSDLIASLAARELDLLVIFHFFYLFIFFNVHILFFSEFYKYLSWMCLKSRADNAAA